MYYKTTCKNNFKKSKDKIFKFELGNLLVEIGWHWTSSKL